MPSYGIGRLKGRFVVNVYDDRGTRLNRYRLNARDAREAEIEAPGVFAELTRPKGSKVVDLWNAYIAAHEGRAIVGNMPHNWKAIERRFGTMNAEDISEDDCKAHAAERKRAGIKPGTVATELGRLRMVLVWAQKKKMIANAPHIERPTPPKRKERHLTREQCRALIDGATMPHVRLFIILALATGGRNAALLELTWDRCDFERGQVNLRNPELDQPHKGRAIVPMNRTLRSALLEAREGALSAHVIEWAGERVYSVKRGLKSSAKAARIRGSVSPHLLRHSAAVHMAEAGIPMAEIAQFLGHDDDKITSRVYARFSPTHLRKAAAVLEYDDLGSTNQESTTREAPKVPEYMVGATGIEPVTPTMSKKRAG